MPKPQIKDVVRVPKAAKSPVKAPAAAPARPEPQPRIKPAAVPRFPMREERQSSRYVIWSVALFSVIFFFFSVSYLFSSAQVTVVPKSRDLVISENFSAQKNSASSPMPFELVSISGEETLNVEATEKKAVETPARGTVFIYNDYGSSPQLLSVDTRLEGSNGKIYKTVKKVTVPGKNKDGTPGRLEVEIYAASPGPDYNSEPLDFKIFGFRGTPKYEKIYARSKGPIAGGVKGEYYVIPEGDRAAATSSLTEKLKAELLRKTTEQIPAGFVLFKDAVRINVDPVSLESFVSPVNSVAVKLRGTLYGFILEEEKLAKEIAERGVDGYDGSPVFIENIHSLAFASLGEPAAPAQVENLNFTLKGPVKLVWKFDEAGFKKDLLGRGKQEFKAVVAKYPNAVSAHLTLKPFWRRSFPDDSKKIRVTVDAPQKI